MTARAMRLVVIWALMTAPAWAQSSSTGAIAGAVKDTTGAVLPGVTVEASSPALIEKFRAAVTDDQGNYKIVDLRPGTYVITFTLPGFATVRREGLELTTGFTATANVEMKVGGVEETVTVTGASPVVDVQNVRSQSVLSRQTLDALPTSKNIMSLSGITVGATLAQASAQDVGGSQGEGFTSMTIHGNRANEGRMKLDGMIFNSAQGTSSGANRMFFVNDAAVQEVTLETGGVSAESETGGIQMNVVPKDGSNSFRVFGNVNYSGDGLQASNLDDELRARGVATAGLVRKIYDIGGGLGGPIKRDRLWFYTAHRWWGAQTNAPGKFYNLTQHTPVYTPDPTRPHFSDFFYEDHSIRATWQATAKQKITLSNSYQSNCSCHFYSTDPTRAPEADGLFHYEPIDIVQANWNYPVRSRLLLEAGALYLYNRADPGAMPEVVPTDISITELSTNFMYNSLAFTLAAGQYGRNFQYGQLNQRYALSYVTGSHAFKTGLFLMSGRQDFGFIEINQALSYQVRFGVPVSLTQWASPAHSEQTLKLNVGTFAQDQWTMDRLTLNLGLRFDHLNAEVPAQHRPAGRFVQAFDFPATPDVPNFNDISPRVGAVYNLFGNGRTALKASVGRYVTAVATNIAFNVNPANALVTSSTRTWTDANGNFNPDCDLLNSGANQECGALNNARFGTVNVTTRYSPDVTTGFGAREYNWQTSASVQQELHPGIALNLGYFRTAYGNFTVTDNLAVTPADYDPYCITAPLDARLPDGGGNQLCGLYDVKPAKFGQIDNLVSEASAFGDRSEVFNGVDVTLNARLGPGKFVQGGASIGRQITENCSVVDSPQQAREGFCRVVPPWSAGAQVKISGVYPLPWGLQASGTFQNLPGVPLLATQVTPNSQIAPSLGRNLAAGAAGTASIDLIPPQTMFEKRLTQVDVRLTRKLRVKSARIEGMVDLYNVFNANTVLAVRTAYGPTWLQPTGILGGRLVKFGAQVDF